MIDDLIKAYNEASTEHEHWAALMAIMEYVKAHKDDEEVYRFQQILRGEQLSIKSLLSK